MRGITDPHIIDPRKDLVYRRWAESQSAPDLRFRPARLRLHVPPIVQPVDLSVRESLRLIRELVFRSRLTSVYISDAAELAPAACPPPPSQ